MAFTFGFYNSLNHDRRYDARQLSSIFDGVILDGVYMSIGDRFMVRANGTDMMITIGTGRAWFNHTWSLNDALLPLEVPQSEVILKRIDAVILEVNEEQENRANRIFIQKGTPSSNPIRPTMIESKLIHQYPLAYIDVAANATSIHQADVTYVVGQTPTPFVTSPLEGMDINDLIAQWQDQWTRFYETETQRWEDFYSSQTQEMLETASTWETTWETWYNNFVVSNTQDISSWKQLTRTEFLAWWEELETLLDGDVAGNLSLAVVSLQTKITALEKFRTDLLRDKAIYDPILDSEGDPILDSENKEVEASVIFATLLDLNSALLDVDIELPDFKAMLNPIETDVAALQTKMESFEEAKGDIISSALGLALGMTSATLLSAVASKIRSVPNRGIFNWNPSGNETYNLPSGYYPGGTLSTANAYNEGKLDAIKGPTGLGIYPAANGVTWNGSPTVSAKGANKGRVTATNTISTADRIDLSAVNTISAIVNATCDPHASTNSAGGPLGRGSCSSKLYVTTNGTTEITSASASFTLQNESKTMILDVSNLTGLHFVHVQMSATGGFIANTKPRYWYGTSTATLSSAKVTS